jgi:tetratricopeptide (TPR) repeat protein
MLLFLIIIKVLVHALERLNLDKFFTQSIERAYFLSCLPYICKCMSDRIKPFYSRYSKLLLIIILINCFEIKAQKADSLFKLLKAAKEDTNKVDVLNELATIKIGDNLLSDALDYANAALELSEKLKYKKGEAYSLNKRGKISFLKAEYNLALPDFIRSSKILNDIGYKKRAATVYMNIANILVINEEYQKGLKYYNDAMEIKTLFYDSVGIAELLGNIGIVQKRMGKYKEAIISFNKCLVVSGKIKYKKQSAVAYGNLASLYAEIKDYKSSLKFGLLSLEMENEVKDYYGVAFVKINLGHTYNYLQEFKKAITYLDSGLAYVIESGNMQDALSAYEGLATAYSGMGNFEKENFYLKKYQSLKDSLYTEEKSEEINKLSAKYDSEKKEREILLLKEKEIASAALTEKKNLWIVISFSFAAILFLGLVLIVTINRNKKKQQEIVFIKTKAELEQTALLAQMNPHFIFNALNSIQYYILSKETEYAYDYLAKFSKLIRQVLINSEQNTIALNKEIETLQLYIELEQRRLKNRFDFEINYADDFPAHDITIPTMLIQPFVENAIWHGIMNMPEEKKGKLTLNFNLNGKQLKISVEDNGIGRKEAALRKVNNDYKSVGVMFTQKRLELLKAVSKQQSEIVITDLTDANGNATGTKVEILMEIIA